MWLKVAKAFQHIGVDEGDDRDYTTICVDLDGTLANESKPFDPKVIGSPRRGAKKWMEKFRQAGARLIIWTVRGDKEQVKTWLNEHEIPFDYINENPDQPADTSDKLIADVYLDNKAVAADGPWSRFGPELLERLDE